ncbi:hypothetical protein ACIOJE_14295 [Kitasatospora sp. NPDC087861]|uniref:hypothetical protein n=1 Tax=unclassified Kitasatospora TaxID=2633591 RepID=UPI002476626F|nr:hypothetical protein [Kitasatospora sp. MAA19]
MAGYTANGIIGTPSFSTTAKGKATLDNLSESAAAHPALRIGSRAAEPPPTRRPDPDGTLRNVP